MYSVGRWGKNSDFELVAGREEEEEREGEGEGEGRKMEWGREGAW